MLNLRLVHSFGLTRLVNSIWIVLKVLFLLQMRLLYIAVLSVCLHILLGYIWFAQSPVLFYWGTNGFPSLSDNLLGSMWRERQCLTMSPMGKRSHRTCNACANEGPAASCKSVEYFHKYCTALSGRKVLTLLRDACLHPWGLGKTIFVSVNSLVASIPIRPFPLCLRSLDQEGSLPHRPAPPLSSRGRGCI